MLACGTQEGYHRFDIVHITHLWAVLLSHFCRDLPAEYPAGTVHMYANRSAAIRMP